MYNFWIILLLSASCPVLGSFNMDPVRNPVLQRLDIPAQLSHHQQDLQLQEHKHIPDVTIEAGKPFVINLPSQTSMAEVTGRDGKPLPPWIVYDGTSHTVRGQPASSDAGEWAVRVDGTSNEVFTIRVRRQILDDDDTNEGSGALIDDYSETDDFEPEGDDETISPDNRVIIAPTTPLFNGASVVATPVINSIPSMSVQPTKSKNLTNPASSGTAIEPTNRQVEPTPVQGMEGPTFRLQDYSNSSLFEPIEPTTSAEGTPPLTDDLDFLGPNSIAEYDEEHGKSAPIPPEVTMRLPRIPATAGKVMRFSIPSGTFSDAEDGNTANMHLELLSQDGQQLEEITWIGFNSTKKEIYGLPLADDIGKYTFLVQARNSANLTVTETVEIQVRQHPSERAFHHHFTLQLEPEFSVDEETLPQAYWMLKTVSGLAKTLGDKEESIVVRRINGTVKNGHAFTFTWSNESLPRSHCPEDEIQESFDLIYNRESDSVTDQLDVELAPQLSVTFGSVELDGICQPLPTNPPSIPQKETKAPKEMNRPPSTRNQVDHLSAEVGVLFRYQVPADTFHDEEDGDTRMLKLSLQNMNHKALDARSWLQFDSPNQEFYGLPLDGDVGTEEYQLLCTDSSGAVESDGLVVAVKERSKLPEDQPLVEFSLTIDDNFDTLMGKASRKVRLIEALAQIFDDPLTSNIIVQSFTSGSTMVTWTNATLVGNECPPSTVIVNLRRMLIDNEGKLTQRCTDILVAADFQPLSAHVSPLGNCVGELTPTFAPGVDDGKTEGVDGPSTDDVWSDDYLLTFIVPGIIITVMLLLAAVIACILYRRRRTGKLGLEERRSFVSKGIPIIFAEELEERPSGRHPAKAPVILKEEKPSQPPDYHKVRSSASPYASHKAAEQHDLLRTPSDEAEEEPNSLYQPPPPLSAGRDSSSRYSRPKATPAYRKPPPYVPP